MAQIGDTVSYVLTCGDDNALFDSLQHDESGALVADCLAALTIEGELTDFDEEAMIGEITATVGGVERVFTARPCDEQLRVPGVWCVV